MTKRGTEKKPLILRVSDTSKIGAITEICEENGWHFIIGVEPNEEEDLTDLERKLNPPTVHASAKIGRNDPCICGSGKKFKKCCLSMQPFE